MSPLIGCLDAAYGDHASAAACVLAQGYDDAGPYEIALHRGGPAAPYAPGALYKRELPLLRAAIAAATRRPDIFIVDGFAYLDAERRPGLGAHLHAAIQRPVIGVAKTAFKDCAAWSGIVRRGRATRPLYVTAIGLTQDEAVDAVASLHGAHRLPALLATTDRAARDALRV